MKQVVVTRGQQYNVSKGVIKHADLIDNKERFGTRVMTANKRGQAFVLKPNTDLYTKSLAQRTQILYTPDISQVLFRLQLRPNMRVVESGTGSGSLSVSLTKAIIPTGHLFTFEFNQDRVGKAKVDFKRLGLGDYITVTHRDVLTDGFLLNAEDEGSDERVTEKSIDAIFIDLPSPEKAIPHCYKILKKRAIMCNFSPCIEQVQKVSQEMAKLGFYNINTIECLSREIQVSKAGYCPIEPVKKEEQPKDDGEEATGVGKKRQ